MLISQSISGFPLVGDGEVGARHVLDRLADAMGLGNLNYVAAVIHQGPPKVSFPLNVALTIDAKRNNSSPA